MGTMHICGESALKRSDIRGIHVPAPFGNPAAFSVSSRWDFAGGTYKPVMSYAFEYEGVWFWLYGQSMAGPCLPGAEEPDSYYDAPFYMRMRNHQWEVEHPQDMRIVGRFRADSTDEKAMLDFVLAESSKRFLEG